MDIPSRSERVKFVQLGSLRLCGIYYHGILPVWDGCYCRIFSVKALIRGSRGTNGSLAANFNFNNGNRNWNHPDNDNNKRALPVRVGK